MTERTQVLWHTPDKPKNISVGRQRIADHLEDNGFDVTIRGTTVMTVLRSLRERNKYEAIVGTTRAGAFAGVLLKYLYQCPLVVDHVDPIRQFEKTHPRWLATLVRVLEGVSFSLANHVMYVYDEEHDRIERRADDLDETDLGVETKRFNNPDSEVVSMAKGEVGDLVDENNIVVYIGGLEPIYHIKELLAAMSHLSKWSLVVIGDGSHRDVVTNAADENENIHYLGTVPYEQIPGYLQVADVGVSLVNDPNTLKILEYGVSGLSVVQLEGRARRRFGDLVEYTDPNPDCIAEAIQHAGENGPDGNLQALASEFDWKDIADDYAEAITSVI